MSLNNSKITPPISRIPIGTVEIDGRSLNVQQHPEFVRFFFDLFRRVGGVNGIGTEELLALLMSQPQSDIVAREALSGIDELRQELSSLRSDSDRIRKQLDDLAASIEPAPNLQPLFERVQTIEGRLQ